MTLFYWPPAALFVCVVAMVALAYWLGFRHGLLHAAASHAAADSRPAAPPRQPPAEPPYIPAYRLRELIVLMELGVLTPEEFEQAKGKLHAG